MKFLFLMDPLEQVHPEKDTSLLLMHGAHEKGHEVYYLPNEGVTLKNGRFFFHTTRVTPHLNGPNPFTKHQTSVLPDDKVDIIFIRTDPPFEDQYVVNTWLLDQLPAHIVTINDPAGIRAVNEKLWAAQFASLVPSTIVSCDRHDLTMFIEEHKEVIAKPTDGHGGQNIFRVQWEDSNTNVILENLTGRFKKKIILQKYLPESDEGDKRIILLNGDPLGAVLRVHNSDDHRNNFFAGGKPMPAEITARDKEIIRQLKPKLLELGLYFVGIDIIGNYLIEVNVTSPTCLQEINHLTGQNLERQVITFAEELRLYKN